jgi:hypothetical protein
MNRIFIDFLQLWRVRVCSWLFASWHCMMQPHSEVFQHHSLRRVLCYLPAKNQDKYPENSIKEPQQKQSLFGGFNYSSFALCILLWDYEDQSFWALSRPQFRPPTAA